jgi:hypothetical protein
MKSPRLTGIWLFHQLKNNTLVVIGLVYTLICLAWISARPQGFFWTVDEGGKLVYIQNILQTGNIFAPIEYPGRELDPALEFVPFTFTNNRQGNLFTWWLPFFQIITVPFYQALGWIGLYILPAFSGGVILWAAGSITYEIKPQDRWLPIIAAGLTGFTTPVLFYSTMFWEHTPAVAAALVSVLCLLRYPKWKGYLPLSAFFCALAFSFRTEIVFFFIGAGLWLLIKNWRIGFQFGVWFLLLCIPILALNWHILGHPITQQLGGIVEGGNFNLFSNFGFLFLAYFFFNPPVVWTFPFGMASLWVGTGGTLAALFLPFMPRLRLIFLLGLAGLLVVSFRLLVSDYGYRSLQGLIVVSPHIVFASWYFLFWEKIKKSDFTYYFLFGFMIYLVVYLYKAWIGAGGLQWGPRYLLVFYPLFTIMTVVGLDDLWCSLRPAIKAIEFAGFVAAALIGLGFEARGLVSVMEVMSYYRTAEPAIQELSDRPLVTFYCDPAWLMEGKYWDQPLFSVTRPGIEAWIDHAKTANINSFYLLELDICTSHPLNYVREYRQSNPSGVRATLYEAPDFTPQPYPLP